MDRIVNDWTSHLADLNRAKKLSVNYDPKTFSEAESRMGWAIDHVHGHIGFEPPGPPSPNGFFARGKEMIANYAFPDPNLVRAYFDPTAPLLGRNMILEARFLGFKFLFANRVNEVLDREVTNELGHPTQIWGFSYQTLDGHFEQGQMSFSIAKDLTSGEISFHIDAYSKVGKIRNLFYRIGFRIFKRPLQRRYMHTSILRMQERLTGKLHEDVT